MILFVEDDKDYRYYLQCLCERSGVIAEYAASGKEALELLTKKTYSHVYTDLSMPHMDGIELLQAIKTRHSIVKLGILTGEDVNSAELRMSKRALALGIGRIIIKPTTPEDTEMLISYLQEATRG